MCNKLSRAMPKSQIISFNLRKIVDSVLKAHTWNKWSLYFYILFYSHRIPEWLELEEILKISISNPLPWGGRALPRLVCPGLHPTSFRTLAGMEVFLTKTIDWMLPEFWRLLTLGGRRGEWLSMQKIGSSVLERVFWSNSGKHMLNLNIRY